MAGSLPILFLGLSTLFAAGPRNIQKNIMIDQFGYRPGDKIIAVIADPVIGTNSNDHFTPGATYEVRSWDNDSAVFTGKPAVWNQGAIDYTSGDKGWWFDFSPVQHEGDYYPMGIVYLSTMYGCGAEYCSDMLWHDWFSDGSPWEKNPPPGYVPGGPNRTYAGSLTELSAQPLQKCYRNWNKG